MIAIKTSPVKAAIIFAIVHFVIQMILFFFAVGIMSTEIELGRSHAFGGIIWTLFMITAFPAIHISGELFLFFMGFGWLLWPINSIIWGAIFYLIINRRKYRSLNGTRKKKD